MNGIFYLFYFFIGHYSVLENKTTLKPQKDQFNIEFMDEIKIDGNRFRAVVKDTVTNEKLLMTYQIPSEQEKNRLQHKVLLKNICRIQGNLKAPSTARNENSFNYQKYLEQKQIFWELQTVNWKFENCQKGRLNIIDKIKLFRLKGISLIEQNFSKETAPMAAALIFGTRDLLSEEVLTSYQKLGVIHLISISGLHVALLVGLIFYLGIRIGFVRERLTLSLIILLPFYAVLTGGTPSVNRSVIMTILILAVRLNKLPFKLNSLDGLCVSFLLLSWYSPFVICNIGFQLSYIVTFSLLLSYSIVNHYRSTVEKIIVTSYISQVCALPFLLYHFFELPLISIAANLLFIPLYSFVFLPGFILLFLFQFVSVDLFQVISIILTVIMDYCNHIAEWISQLSWTRLILGRPPVYCMFLYTCSIFIAFYSWDKKSHFKILMLLPWMVLWIQLFSSSLLPNGEVSIIDVGQGDSIFIHLPNDSGNYLIDTGGSILFKEETWKRKKQTFEVGQDVLVPFLKSKGIRKLDLLILSHGDMDHIGASLSLLKEIKVKRILLPSVKTEVSAFEKEIVQFAKEHSITVSYVLEGLSWKVKNNEFFILSPPEGYQGDKNDGSIVLYAKIGGVSWLFTGDLGKEGEMNMMKKYPNLTVDILKVGHHGSKNSTSTEFIEKTHPKYSVISVGEKNGFGHPHSEVLKILEEEGSKILRTDQDGEITYKFRGEKGTFFKVIP